ncbi:polysaccharide lyase family 8 super-sandwich domain-containing protein [Jiangella asiatica]|uniref:Hyaluronate lyase n=1 Tax=Jiangella asiatica TaxID=2530372 RepID=A0A4R5DBV3_9ACTN|nr:polysaccharide lyase family 8 super-sandwich domain-containing protein [Jiangella asiatica]TDE11186.1 hypothetical protein E1269_09950 [Jiangella asiatica]
MSPFTRRSLLSAAGATAAALAVPGIGVGGAQAQPDATAALRARWRDMMTGASLVRPGEPVFVEAIAAMDAEVAESRALYAPSDVGVFSDVELANLTDSAMLTTTYGRLRDMARAWFTPGSAVEGDAHVLAEVLEGLRVANAVAYYEGREEAGNWYPWQIAAPRRLGDTMAIVYDHLPAADRDRYVAAIRHFVPDPSQNGHSGANRVDTCMVAAIDGIVSGSSERIAQALDGLRVTYQYIKHSTEDGFMPDGSFLQHTGVPYNGSYGLTLVAGISSTVALLAGSPWEITDPTIHNLFGLIDLGYVPLIHDGRMMDCVNGRTIARPPAIEHTQGQAAINAILGLVPAVDAQTQARWRAACRGWLERDTYHPPYEGLGVAAAARFHDLLTDAGVTPSPEPDGHFSYGPMDRAVHRRNGWAVAIAMHSRWVKAFEANNGENRKGTYTASGMTYLYDGDNGQYSDNFWPTVDKMRLPGITVDTTPLSDDIGWRTSTALWAGGAALDGSFGAVGMDVQERVYPLAARKSWFCFDEYVLALGTVIESPTGNSVETIVENRHLHADGKNELRVDGSLQPDDQGWTGTFSNARWAHIDGVAGYVFPAGLTVNAFRNERTGSWADMRSGGDPTPITRRYLTLWVDHGAHPSGDTYAYLLVPGASAARTAELATDPDLEILSDTKDLHAVRQPSTGITAANFWDAGTVGGITAEPPANTDVPTLVFDDLDPTFEIVSGTWLTGQGNGRWNGHQHHAHPAGGTAVARFHITVPVSGRYGVDAWWFDGDSRATDTPFAIQHDGGVTERLIGQRTFGSRWVPLGAFDFTAGKAYYVEVRDGTNGVAVADAVRLGPMRHRGGCSVLVRERGSELSIAVSDPTQEQARLRLSVEPRGRYRTWTGDDTVEVVEFGDKITIAVDTSAGDARSHRVTFHRRPPRG